MFSLLDWDWSIAIRRLGLSTAWVALFMGSFLTTPIALAQQMSEVASAGFAYLGSESTIRSRFRYSKRYEDEQKTAGLPVGVQLSRTLKSIPGKSLTVVDQIADLNGRVDALAVALVIGSETVSVEQIGLNHKLTVLIRGQTMFFDFNSKTVVRAYPISFAYIDVFDHVPQPDEIMTRVRLVYRGANGKPGLIDRFVNNVVQAEIPKKASLSLGVTSVKLTQEAIDVLPSYLKTESGTAQSWAADLVSEAISTRAGVPIIPYAQGYAVDNVMRMTVADGTVWDLKLKQPDYKIAIEITNFKKLKFNEVQGGATSFVYGAYAQMSIEDLIGGKSYFNASLKNGETRIIPASQQYVDDFPHYYDAVNGLFTKLAQAIGSKGDDRWLKTAAASKDIDQQLIQTKELVETCK